LIFPGARTVTDPVGTHSTAVFPSIGTARDYRPRPVNGSAVAGQLAEACR